MEEHLFLDKYQSQTTSEWRRLVQSDLKNIDFSTLEWQSAFGITVQPYYTREDVKDISYPGNIYAEKSSHQKWENLEKIVVEDEVSANKLALHALNAGADGIIFEISTDQISLSTLLQNILLQHCNIYFSGKPDISSGFVAYCNEQNIEIQSIQGGMLSSTKHDKAIELLKTFPIMKFKLLYVHEKENGEKGDLHSLVDVLLQITEIVEKLTDQGLEAHTAFKNLIVRFKTSNSYYFEICKARAFRLLLLGLARAFDVRNFTPDTVHIHLETSPENGENIDQNMIRNTSQAMSAILGGCDSIYITPHDLDVHSGFSRRIARNISLILKEEAYFGKVSDPAAGSYFFESLTRDITEKVWNEFITVQNEKK